MSSQQPINEFSDETPKKGTGAVLEDHNYNRMSPPPLVPISSKRKSVLEKNKQNSPTVCSKLADSIRYSGRASRSIDECVIYSKLLAMKLRKLPRNERMIFMNKIDGLFIQRLYKKAGKVFEIPSNFRHRSPSNFHIRNSPPTDQSSSSEHIINITIPELPSSDQTSYIDPIINIINPNQPSSSIADIEQNEIGPNGKKRRRQRIWMTNIHKSRTCEELEQKFYELLNEPSGDIDSFCCLSYSDFESILKLISPIITKRDTNFRPAIQAKYRLAIALRYLASGDSFTSIHHMFKISIQSVSKIVRDVCRAINEVLKNEIKMPVTAEDWMTIERGYRSNFPHCVGCLDAKRIIIGNNRSDQERKKPSNVVLMSLIDSDHKFIFAEVGSKAGQSDDEFFNNSLLWQRISNKEINFPTPCPLPGLNDNVPYVFLADSPFALSSHVMKPYPGEHEVGSPKWKYNQCFFRSRTVVENAFGVISSVFRIFRRPIDVEAHCLSDIMKTCLILHNYLMKSETSVERYAPPGTFDVYDSNGDLISPGSWRTLENVFNAIQNLRPVPSRTPLQASLIREEFASYFYIQ